MAIVVGSREFARRETGWTRVWIGGTKGENAVEVSRGNDIQAQVATGNRQRAESSRNVGGCGGSRQCHPPDEVLGRSYPQCISRIKSTWRGAERSCLPMRSQYGLSSAGWLKTPTCQHKLILHCAGWPQTSWMLPTTRQYFQTQSDATKKTGDEHQSSREADDASGGGLGGQEISADQPSRSCR